MRGGREIRKSGCKNWNYFTKSHPTDLAQNFGDGPNKDNGESDDVNLCRHFDRRTSHDARLLVPYANFAKGNTNEKARRSSSNCSRLKYVLAILVCL